MAQSSSGLLVRRPLLVIPAKAGIQRLPRHPGSSFPRRRESSDFRASRLVIPAKAGIRDSFSTALPVLVIPAKGGIQGHGFSEQQSPWIPAFAGMTERMDSRLRGNDGADGFPPSRE